LSGRPTAETGPPKATPQEIRKSISHDFLVSFEIVADISRHDIGREGNEAGCLRVLFTGVHGAIFYEGALAGIPLRWA
jgi:hypothetical protein